MALSLGLALAGADGADGADDKDGANGTNGTDGEDCAPGADGMNGDPGAPGKSGFIDLTKLTGKRVIYPMTLYRFSISTCYREVLLNTSGSAAAHRSDVDLRN